MTTLTLPHPAHDLLGPFLDAQLRPATQIAYRADLIAFFGTHLITEDQAQTVTVEDVERWRNDLAEAGAKPSTINRKLTSLRAFYRRCMAQGIVDRSPADPALVRGYKTPTTSVGKAIATDDYMRMLELAQAQKNPLRAARDYALLTVLLYTGLRRAEAANLQWGDILVEGAHTVALLRDTKSGHEQHVKLSGRVREALQALSDAYDGQFDYVFVSLCEKQSYGQRIRPSSISRIVRQYGERIGLSITAHSLRHTCATLALEGGASVQQVQSHLRHANVTTTMRYYEDRNQLDDNATDYILAGGE